MLKIIDREDCINIWICSSFGHAAGFSSKHISKTKSVAKKYKTKQQPFIITIHPLT